MCVKIYENLRPNKVNCFITSASFPCHHPPTILEQFEVDFTVMKQKTIPRDLHIV